MTEKQITLPEGLDVDTATDVLSEYAHTEEAEIIEQSRLDALESEIQEAKDAFAAVLAEQSPQSQETLARQDMDALSEPFRDEEGDIDVDTLRQEPQTGDPESGAGDPDPETEVELDSLSLEDRRKIKEQILPKMSSFRSRGMDSRVDALEGEVTELVGAESFEDIEADLEAL